MRSGGLSRGARLVRRYRATPKLWLVHPWKAVVSTVLLPFNLVAAYGLYLTGKLGDWMSRLEYTGEAYAGWWGDWVESDREHEIRYRAWHSRPRRHGDCIRCSEEGDPTCPYYGEPDGCNARDIRDKAVFDGLRDVVAKAKEEVRHA